MESLVKTSDSLKKDIQSLIDKSKTRTLSESEKKEKSTKLRELESITKNIKDINKQLRIENKKKNEITRLTNTMNTLDYQTAKKKGKTAIDNANEQRQQRERAKEEYFKLIEFEKDYYQFDPKDFPATLFFHEKITSRTGICPYLNKNNTEEEMVITSEKRKNWLQENDTLKIYNELYDKLFNTKYIENLTNNEYNIVDKIENIICDILNKEQMKIYENSCEILNEYMKCSIKTKRIKEKYKTFINNLSVLKYETDLDLNKYLSVKYEIPIVINDINESNAINIISKHTDFYYVDLFNKLIEELSKLREEIKTNKKYITNTNKNLQQALLDFLSNGSKNTKQDFSQTGKFFCRWNSLTQEQKDDRFESFSTMYVIKNMINKNILDLDKKQDMINQLFKLLSDSYNEKTLVYKDISWNVKSGIISSVKSLLFDVDNYKFYLKNKNIDNNNVPETVKRKRKKSSRTIISKENENVINEIVLESVLKFIENNTNTLSDQVNISDDLKIDILNKIKLNLGIKKILVQDKNEIYEKCDEIFQIVKSNY
jgi:hypothetical protein